MKKIINGKMYDTETATFVGETYYGVSGDLDHVWEALYQSPNGQWFLAGRGGARSKYGIQTAPNSWSGGSCITLLSPEEALAWCENYLDAEDFADRFPVSAG